MKKRIMTLMAGMLLLLTACGQTREQFRIDDAAGGGGSERGTRPSRRRSGQGGRTDVDSLPAEEDTEEAEAAGGEDAPKLAE